MSSTGTRTLGVISVIFAVICIAVWIPLDTDTGLIESVRRRVEIGDALAPTLAAVFVLIGGVMLIVAPGQPGADPTPLRPVIRFGAAMLGLLILAFLLMLSAGPVAVALANLGQGDPMEYRLLRGSAPWKYIGFVLGGTLAISGTICLAERRVTGRAVAIGVLAVIAMIAVFDLPFDDLLLPPNGDY